MPGMARATPAPPAPKAVAKPGARPPAPYAMRTLRLAIALGLAVGAAPSLFRSGDNPAKAPIFEPIAMPGLTEIRSHNGVLEATLVAAPLTVHIGALSFAGAGYNGAYPGPVLRVQPGDRIVLHLVNHMADAINLHFHGARVPPSGHGDNMQILVPPGGRFDYDFRVPRTHPPGLFWFHDHAHGAAEPHVMAGLSGSMIIEGFAGSFGTLGAVAQQLLVLKDWNQPACEDSVLKKQFHCRVISINGLADWSATLRPGQTQLWRISNQSANLTMHLAAPGLHAGIIGRDSTPTTRITDTDQIDIMPASRVDVLVRASAPGVARLVATHVPTGSGSNFSTQRQIGTLFVAGAPAGGPPPAPLFPRQEDLRHRLIDARRTIRFGENAAATVFTVDGRVFDPSRTDLRVPFGTTEQWVIRNETEDFHEFHIHQLGFQVTAINGAPQDFDGYVDNVSVPEHGNVTVLIPFTDPIIIGHFMYHCHVLKHEDRGMMAMIEVYRPGLPHLCLAPQE